MGEDTKRRFQAIKVDEALTGDMEIIRDGATVLAMRIEAVVPESRERSLALTKLEEVVFWANAGIARNG